MDIVCVVLVIDLTCCCCIAMCFIERERGVALVRNEMMALHPKKTIVYIYSPHILPIDEIAKTIEVAKRIGEGKSIG